MNGTELCEQDCGTIVLFAPHGCLSAAMDQRSQAPPARWILSRAGVSPAVFRSSGTTVSSRDHHSGINAPGLLLRRRTGSPSDQSTLCSTAGYGFDPATCGFIARTLGLTTTPALPDSPRTSTPLQGFSSLRDRSVQPDSVPGKPAFRNRPISFRSPQPIRFKS